MSQFTRPPDIADNVLRQGLGLQPPLAVQCSQLMVPTKIGLSAHFAGPRAAPRIIPRKRTTSPARKIWSPAGSRNNFWNVGEGRGRGCGCRPDRHRTDHF